MNTADVLALLDAEIAKLIQARTLIAASALATGKRKRGRPKSAAAPVAKPAKKKAKRNLSPEGRARIAEALKKRWAAQKKAAAKQAKKAPAKKVTGKAVEPLAPGTTQQ